MARYYCRICGLEMPRSLTGACIRCTQEERIKVLTQEVVELVQLMPMQMRALYHARFPSLPKPDTFTEESKIVRLRRCVKALENQRDYLVGLGRDLSYTDPEFNNKRLECSQGQWHWVRTDRCG